LIGWDGFLAHAVISENTPSGAERTPPIVIAA